MNGDLAILNNIINTLGAPGIIVICMGAPSLVMAFIYADHRRYEREKLKAVEENAKREARLHEESEKNKLNHQKEMAAIKEQFFAIINAQEKRFEAVAAFYEKNVYLVEGYHKLANELTSNIYVSTQIMTKLVEKIENNLFCPIVNGRRKDDGV